MPIINDVCVFRYQDGQIIVIYVDDMLVIAHNIAALKAVITLLKDRFKMRELSDLYYYLSMRIVRNRDARTIYVVQDAYLNRLAIKYSYNANVRALAILIKYSRLLLRKALETYIATPALKKEY